MSKTNSAHLRQALDLALTHHLGTGCPAETVLRSAELLRRYLDGRVALTGAHQLDLDVRDAVDGADSHGNSIQDVGSIGRTVEQIGATLPFEVGDVGGNFPDQVFSGHSSSSSVTADGESAAELPTPSRDRIIVTTEDGALVIRVPLAGA